MPFDFSFAGDDREAFSAGRTAMGFAPRANDRFPAVEDILRATDYFRRVPARERTMTDDLRGTRAPDAVAV